MKLLSFASGFIKKTSHPVLGLDIGSHSIKIVELAMSGGKITIRKAGRALVPLNAIKDGIIEDKEAVARVLRMLLDNLDPRFKNAATSIAGYSVIVKKISVPYADEKDIEENLDIEAENYVPFEITDVYIDFHMLESSNAKRAGRSKTDIFLVAAKREIVDSYAALIHDVGLVPVVVDIDAFALSNSFESAYGVLERPVCLIDIGARKTNLNIVGKGISLFAKDIAMGGAQITEEIQAISGFSFEDAENIKMTGVGEIGLLRDISVVIKEICTQWGQEIKKILDFHRSNSSEEDWPERIYLSGGASLMNGVADLISNETGLEVAIFNPFQNAVLDKLINPEYISSIAPQMAIAFGLALRDS
ncbi:MAG: type IV pilus assembly protein PilM [Dissulfurimicrobium sp.]|uniref:type IV pilus assembly protein PilM n=1 Tax=Dissulfurimicrobium sp. TaxID=2022436 RepID=UPI0040496571